MPSKRTAARLIVQNGLGGVLLVRFQGDGEHWWATPGGGLDGDESLAEAAHREAVEELGVPVVLRDEVWRRTATFTSLSGVLTEQTEHYFRAEVNDNHISPDLRRLRDEGVTDVRWWTLDEMSTTKETIYPDGLCDLLAGLPDHPVGAPIQVQ
jgi:8-oxo-dGTP pyrophosphatase MutT (NUDIX family)